MLYYVWDRGREGTCWLSQPRSDYMVPQGAFSQRKRQQAYCSSFFLVSWLRGALPTPRQAAKERGSWAGEEPKPSGYSVSDKEQFHVQTKEQERILTSLNYCCWWCLPASSFYCWKSPSVLMTSWDQAPPWDCEMFWVNEGINEWVSGSLTEPTFIESLK